MPEHAEVEAYGPDLAPQPAALLEDPPPPPGEAAPAPAEHAQPEEPQAAAEPEPEPAEPEATSTEAPEQSDPEPALFLGRGRIRRRARYLRRLREVQLRDLGGFIVELRRFEQQRPELVQTKVEGALRTDAELRALERALGTDQPLRELREAGVGGACAHCGTIHGTDDHFCSTCGEPLSSHAKTDGSEPR